MEDIALGSLYTTLLILILLSGFFSSSETGLMAINKYRLRHLANKGHRGARLAQRLLKTPDRLIGLILLATTWSISWRRPSPRSSASGCSASTACGLRPCC